MALTASLPVGGRARTRWAEEPLRAKVAWVARAWNGEKLQRRPGGAWEERGGLRYVGEAKGLSQAIILAWMDARAEGRAEPKIPEAARDLLLEVTKGSGIDLTPRPRYSDAHLAGPPAPAWTLAMASLGIAGFVFLVGALGLYMGWSLPSVEVTLPVLVGFVLLGITAQVVALASQRPAEVQPA